MISVVVPTYNQVDFLRQAVESVLDQSYSNIEIIVVDDGSTDNTNEDISQLDGPIRLIRIAHTGKPAAVRNIGIRAARGLLIAFLDHDDLWFSEKLEKQLPVFQNRPQTGLVFCDVRRILSNGSYSRPLLEDRYKNNEAIFDKLLMTCFIHPSTVIVHRALFDRIGYFDETFTSQSNYYFWLLAAFQAPVECVSETLVAIRQHPGSNSRIQGINVYFHFIEVIKRIRETVPLSIKQKLIARKSLSRACAHLGLHHGLSIDQKTARSFFIRSLRYYPIQKKSWIYLVQSYFNKRIHGDQEF